jgi:hypothetical protein
MRILNRTSGGVTLEAWIPAEAASEAPRWSEAASVARAT